MTENVPARPSEFLLYQTEDGTTRVQTRFSGETVWISINQMAELFQRDKSVISRHIKNVFDEGELSRNEATVANFATVQREVSREISRDVETHFQEVIEEVKQIEQQSPDDQINARPRRARRGAKRQKGDKHDV